MDSSMYVSPGVLKASRFPRLNSVVPTTRDWTYPYPSYGIGVNNDGHARTMACTKHCVDLILWKIPEAFGRHLHRSILHTTGRLASVHLNSFGQGQQQQLNNKSSLPKLINCIISLYLLKRIAFVKE